MNRRAVVPALALAILAGPPVSPDSRLRQDDDPILHVMNAELARVMQGLGTTDRPPYYVSYEIWDQWTNTLAAQNGALITDQTNRSRLLDVDVRVGSHTLDNTGRVQGRSFFPFGAGPPERLPIDTSVTALRNALWLRTETEYRNAVERLIQVQATRATTVSPRDTSPDFSQETPYVLVEEIPSKIEFDREAWKGRVRRLSDRFRMHPGIFTSTVRLAVQRQVRYITTTEGTGVRTGDNHIRLMVNATTRADDGMDLSLNRTFFATSFAGLPSEEDAAQVIDSVISDLVALRDAPVVDPYSGPAILGGQAAGVFFHEILGHRLEGHRQKDENFAQTFTSKVGQQILPPFITVSDDPTVQTYNGVELSGHYRTDDEGMPARRALLVDKGVLAGFTMGRSPVDNGPRSNGHGRRQPGRDVVARQANLLVESNRTVSTRQLRQQLIDQIQRQGKPYGLFFTDIAGGFTFTGRYAPQVFKVIPLKVYRVFVDGRPDELVRGVDIVGTPLTVFGKILATDDTPRVFNGFCGAESGSIPVSAVSPSVLISEIEVEKKATSMRRPPVLGPPGPEPVAGGEPDDIVLRAMRDELTRSGDSLRVQGLADPYYVAYRVSGGVTLDIDARLGAVVEQRKVPSRLLFATVRVGGYDADQSGFFSPTSRFAAARTSLAMDDAYSAIRRQLWWATDMQYKAAAATLAQKQAALEGDAEPDTIPDFSAEVPHINLQPRTDPTVPEDAWTSIAKNVSAVFNDYPAITDGRVRVRVRRRNQYFASTEGSRSRVPDVGTSVLITAVARSQDGSTMSDYRVFAGQKDSHIPDEAALSEVARTLAQGLSARVEAEELKAYLGPVLFEGPAAGGFFFYLLGQSLGGDPPPRLPRQMGVAMSAEHPLKRYLGRRLLPEGFAISDDPTLIEYRGIPLAGHYLVDHEGMPARRVDIMTDGRLRAFVTSRIPSQEFTKTTGHARSLVPGLPSRATISNLIVEARDPRSESELREAFVELIREVGLEFGIAIKQLADDDPQVGAALSRFGPMGARQGLQLPYATAAYKVFPDGREEPVRPVEFLDLSLRTLRDVAAGGGSPGVFHFVHVTSPPPFAWTRWVDAPITVVAPTILVKEMDLKSYTTTAKPLLLGKPGTEAGR